jgi:hypothetical protein
MKVGERKHPTTKNNWEQVKGELEAYFKRIFLLMFS